MAFEITVALIGLGGAIVGGGITSGTTWLIARSERSKFARERLWDLRREAYTRIIGSIVPAARIAHHMYVEYQDDPHTYDASDSLKQAVGEYITHMRAAREVFNNTRLVLSAAFVREFEDMIGNLDGVSSNPNLIPPESAEMTWEVLKKDSKRLEKLAVREVQALA